MIKEFNIKVKLKVATYGSDFHIKRFVEDLIDVVDSYSRKNANFILEHKPEVEVSNEPTAV